MSSVEDLIREASLLSPEEQALLIDRLLLSMNPSDRDIDRAWAEVAKRRLADIRGGRVAPVPGEQVLAEISDLLKE